LGVDLGWNPDPFAYTIWAFCQNYPVAFEIDSFKQVKLSSDDQAEIIQRLMQLYDFTVMVLDATGAGANIHAAWVARGIPIKKAEKTSGAYSKRDYIELMNGALLASADLPDGTTTQSRLKFRRNSPLSEELQILQWKERSLRSLRPEEDKGHSQNDCADASLYVWKEMYQWSWEPLQQAAQVGTTDYYQKFVEQWERIGMPPHPDETWDSNPYDYYTN